MKHLELKIPPPAVALLLALLMWGASHLVQPLEIAFGIRLVAGVALALAGQGISVSGMVAFRRARTTINPFKPAATSSLVSGGVYRFTRNPMYLGMFVTLLGWAAFLANPLALALTPLFVLYINRFQITPEERMLSSLFGAEFNGYAGRVRRWL
jgi:protein-S-isoprenylcysteine O-methyltransferase Ste14